VFGNHGDLVGDASLEPPGFPTGVEDPGVSHPVEFTLEQNYPNPFNPATTIRYTLMEESQVMLRIFSVAGEEVTMLVSETQSAGTREAGWDARNVASGVYLFQIEVRPASSAGVFTDAKKMLVLK